MGCNYSVAMAAGQKVQKEDDLPTCDESPVEKGKGKRKGWISSKSKAKCHLNTPAH